MRIRREPAVIIKQQPFKETSKIVTFFSPQQGRFNGLIKGASRLKGHLVSNVDLFCYGEVSYLATKEGQLATITDFIAEERFLPIRENLDKLHLASSFARILNQVTESDPAALFQLFLSALYYLKERDDTVRLEIYFSGLLFNLMGQFPQMDSCINCSNKLSSSRLLFSAELGGEVGSECLSLVRETAPYNRKTWLKFLCLLRLPLDQIDEPELSKDELAELKIFCSRYRECLEVN